MVRLRRIGRENKPGTVLEGRKDLYRLPPLLTGNCHFQLRFHPSG